jgi:carbamoylphosphate synthase small subunit
VSEALLVLEDGRTFRGEAYGKLGTTVGEAVFATGMTGYQETLTDPSYAQQIVVMTAPHIGNTGVNDEATPRAGRPTGGPPAAWTTSSWRRASSGSAAWTPAR